MLGSELRAQQCIAATSILFVKVYGSRRGIALGQGHEWSHKVMHRDGAHVRGSNAVQSTHRPLEKEASHAGMAITTQVHHLPSLRTAIESRKDHIWCDMSLQKW